MEVRVGFEPTHRGFADLSLNHLGTAPLGRKDGQVGGLVKGNCGLSLTRWLRSALSIQLV